MRTPPVNQCQAIVLCITGIVLVLMLLFPPYVNAHEQGIIGTGFGFIFALPTLWKIPGTVNTPQLIVQAIIVVAAGVFFYFATSIFKDEE